MSLVLNMVGGAGGGLTMGTAVLCIAAPLKSTITIAKESVVVKVKEIADKQITAGENWVYYYYPIRESNFGTYTVTVTHHGLDTSLSVSVSAPKDYFIDLSQLVILKYQTDQTNFTRLSCKSGDTFRESQYGRQFVRNSEEPILTINDCNDSWNGYGCAHILSAKVTGTWNYVSNGSGEMNGSWDNTTASGTVFYIDGMKYKANGAITYTLSGVASTISKDLNKVHVWTEGSGATLLGDATQIALFETFIDILAELYP